MDDAQVNENNNNMNKNSPWHAMRSAVVNPVFYNPKIEYKDRLDKNGNVVNESVDYPGITWVSNQETTRFRYCVSGYAVDPTVNNASSGKAGLRHIYSYRQTPGMSSMDNSCVVDVAWDAGLGIGGGEMYSPLIHDRNGRNYLVPKLLSHTGAPASNSFPAFTYMKRCDDVYYDFQNISGEPWNTVKGCKAKDMFKPGTTTWEYDMVELKPNNLTAIVDLPADHQRSDCAQATSNKCTAAEEMQNVIRWYKWYHNNGASTASAIGRVLANPDYKGKMRLGYYNTVLKRNVAGNVESSSGVVAAVEFNSHSPKKNRPVDMRGVRDTGVSANNDAVYSWLYKTLASPYSSAALPLRVFNRNIGAIEDYFADTSSGVENPWANDPSKPISSSNPALSCRRSFMVFISNMDYLMTAGGADGTAWDNKSYNIKNNTGYNNLDSGKYNASFPFTGYDHEGTRYKNDKRLRSLYTPYTTPDWGTGSDGYLRMSKKTARLYWHTDFLPNVANEIPVRDGQPAAWQNLTTYTLGYMIRPSGELAHSNNRGLTFKQIEEHKREWLLNGTMNKRPKWVRPSASSAIAAGSAGFLANPRGHIDDFIQAGYTGGGAGFAVMNPADMERTFDQIISEIISYKGNDSGISISGAPANETFSMDGRVSYTVDYDLSGNAGTLKAVVVDGSGGAKDQEWSTNDVGIFRDIPARTSPTAVAAHVNNTHREFFYMSSAGARNSMTGSTTSNTVGGSAFFGNDARIDHSKVNFPRYLLGDNTEATSVGGLWRQRTSPFMGASVNSAPVFVQGRLNMAYANAKADVGPGSGASDRQNKYIDYFMRKYNRPATIYSATNAGVVHVFNAGKAGNAAATAFAGHTNGQEIAAYLLRSTATKQPLFANPANKFQYMADGPLVEHDIYDKAGAGSWRNIVFGSLGRGGKGIFAFEAPLAANAAGGTTAKPTMNQFLWERDDNATNEWGYITNEMKAGVNNADVAMLVTTTGHYVGIENSNGSSTLNTNKVGLAVLNPLTGAVLKHIPTAALGRSATGPIGLGGVRLIRNEKQQIVGAYAGDERGNLWRFYLGGSDVSKWQAFKIFTSPTVAPIYAAPAWQTHPGNPDDTCRDNFTEESKGSCGNIVVFGTGMLLEDAHQANTQQNYLVGIWDMTPMDWKPTDAAPTTLAPASWNAVLQQRTIDLSTQTQGQKPAPEVSEDLFYKINEGTTSSPVTVNWTRSQATGQPTQRGWYMALGQLGAHVKGERVLADLINVGTSVFASSTVLASNINEETCNANSGSANVLYGIDALTGGHRKSFSKDQSVNEGQAKTADFSVSYRPGGGFNTGLAYTQRVERNGDAPSYLMQLLLETGGDIGEGKPDVNAGTPDKSNPGGVVCGADGCVEIFPDEPLVTMSGWKRNWRRLINLPSTLIN